MLTNLTKPLIMGILNATPDSFSDGGKFTQLENALQHALQMVKEGASIIDIGGESTRPNSEPVSPDAQIKRVVPIIEAIRKYSDVLISIDTTLSVVAAAALKAGANLINDVSAGQNDAKMFVLAAQKHVPIILMHAQGTPKTMQENPYYEHVVKEVSATLIQRANEAMAAGVKKENIVLDVGIGFGKRQQDNLELLAHLADFVALGFPVLLGASRKRFMGAICDVNEPAKLVTATAVTTALGVMANVQLFRVHDVKENKQALDVAWAIKNRMTID
jgi:dihydropteroate synthase